MNHTHSYLSSLLSYDRDTGLFLWKVPGKGRPRYPFAGTEVRRSMRNSEIPEKYQHIVQSGLPLSFKYDWIPVHSDDGELIGQKPKLKPEFVVVDGYRLVIDGKQYAAHELAWFLERASWHRVYHIDGDRTNNRWDNLTTVKPKHTQPRDYTATNAVANPRLSAAQHYARVHGEQFTPIQEMDSKRNAVMEQVEYNPATGKFRRKLLPKLGWNAGIKVNNGSYAISITILTPHGARKTTIPAHVAAYILQTGDYPTGKVTHINNDKGDNRWENLRDE